MIAPSLVNLFLFRPPENKGYALNERVAYVRNKRGNRVATIYLRKPGANVTILFSHGNAEDLNSAHRWMKKLSEELDVNVIGYDYTGYGQSSSVSPTEGNCYADIEAVYAHLLEDYSLTPEQIVLYGRSLGSGPSCFLAAKSSNSGRPVAGLILHSPFASVYRVVFDCGVSLPGDKFTNIDSIGKVKAPVFITHGRLDSIVPVDHGASLFEATDPNFRATPYFAENMTHSYNGHESEVILMKKLNKYLDYHILARRLWMKPKRSSRT